MEFCNCGSIMDFGVCSNRHCGRENKEWIIDGVQVNFKEPVTRDRALELIRQKSGSQRRYGRIEINNG